MGKNKELNDFVASFRIPLALKAKIEERLRTRPVTGCKSANQYMRKCIIDRHTEKVPGKPATILDYADVNDDKEAPEIAAEKRSILAAQAAQSPATAG